MCIYSGDSLNNLPNGKGELIFPEQIRFAGTFKNNNFEGAGTLHLSDKQVFSGDFH